MNVGEPVLDLEVARRLIPGGAKGMRSIAALTRTDCPQRMAEAQEACRQGEAEVVFRAAHSLKATFGWFGAKAAAQAARAVESPAKQGDMDAAIAALPALQSEATRFMAALDELETVLASDPAADSESAG